MKKIGIIGSRVYKRHHNYYDAVTATGGEPIDLLLGYCKNGLDGIDGIIIPGGDDINPRLYNEPNTKSYNIDDNLDNLEMKIIKDAVERKIPMLGSCRGHQILNVFFGGSLIQNVQNLDIHKAVGQNDRAHMTKVDKNSFLYEIYKDEKISVNSAHHQAVKVLGKGFRAVQYSEDGLIEASEHESLPIYSVQWHPERMALACRRDDTVDGLEIFKFFIKKLHT